MKARGMTKREYPLAEKLALRAKHTCVKKMTSMTCTACNSGVPYPELTIDEMIEQMRRARR